ncbi:MAG: rhodanese-like domain-containing protein [Rhodobacteraceae bacterium]|nr:rhodanese-like domain-containing protein [Paracoccaceae bacterium]
MYRVLCYALIGLVITSLQAIAQDVGITPEQGSFSVTINGEVIEISRIQDTSHRLTPDFTKTSRPCPPFCIHPVSAAPGVVTLGEIEVLSFLEDHVENGTGLLVDARVPQWYAKGTIPGSVNIPFPAVEASNPFRDEILKALGAVQSGNGWNFDNAMELALFCNGPWCDQSPRAIKALMAAGYPAQKLRYYRGGIQMWMLLGLTLNQPNS